MSTKPTFEYERPVTKTSDFNTPVFFYTQTSSGPEPGARKGTELFHCLAQAYAPSSKDRAALDSHEITEGVTIKIPDPLGEFIPLTSHLVEIQDYRNQNGDQSFKIWNVVEVDADYEDNRLIKIILGRDET